MPYLWECCDCGALFDEPDTNIDPDNDCCPVCEFDEIRQIDEPAPQPACTACAGSGYYDDHGSPKCGACGGTGLKRQREA